MMKHWVRTVCENAFWGDQDRSSNAMEGINRIIQLIENSDVHLLRTEELEQICDHLADTVDLEELSELMWRAATSTGFQNFAIFVLHQGQGSSFKSRICTSFHDEWIARYIQNNYQYVDPVMSKASISDDWFLYSDLAGTAPAVKCFWRDAEKHRIGRNGVCFPMTRSDGTRVAVSFTTLNTNTAVEEAVRLNGYDLRFIAESAVDAFCYAASDSSLENDTLTVDELRFLHVLATSADPEEALKITPSFGSNKSLQVSIRKKLSVDTVYQAVAIAASRNWFNTLPYDTKEILKTFNTLSGVEATDHQLSSKHYEGSALQQSQPQYSGFSEEIGLECENDSND